MNDTRRRTPLIIFATLVVGLLAACGGALWAGPTGFLPRLQQARSLWEAQQIRHYRMTVRWTYGPIVNGPWQLEIADGKILSGFHLRYQRPMTRSELRLAEQNLEINTMFQLIADEVKPSVANTPRYMLARGIASFSPQLRDLIDRCAPLIPSVDYHPTRGYPTGVTVHGSPCYRASEWTILVSELTPLP
ncbi:MAG: hypothetical protein Fur005_09890 [Roseiflexaceae bacterium]